MACFISHYQPKFSVVLGPLPHTCSEGIMRDIERRERQEARSLKRAAKEARSLRPTRVKHKKLKIEEHGDMRLFEDGKLGDDEAFQDGHLMTLNVVPPMCEPHI
jgi:hypothetical protein